MRSLYVAPIGAKNYIAIFSINITLLRSLKVLILLGFMKKPTLISLSRGEFWGLKPYCRLTPAFEAFAERVDQIKT
jgi:hypothetical protein